MLVKVKMLDHSGFPRTPAAVDAVLDVCQVVKAFAQDVPGRGVCTVVHFRDGSQPWQIVGPPEQLIPAPLDAHY